MASPGKPAPLSPSKLSNGNFRTAHSSPTKRGISEQSSHDVLTARERFASEGQENQAEGGVRCDAASPLTNVSSDGAAEHTPEPQALNEEGRAYSPNSNPFGKRPATRTPAGSYIAARRRTSGNSDSGLPSVPDFQRSPREVSSQGPATPASPQLQIHTGDLEADAEAQEWLSSPDVAFDEVASTWEAVGRLSDLYDEALNDSMKKAHSNQVRSPSPASPSPSPALSERSQKPDLPASLATVAEEEELGEGGPAVGRLPLVTDLGLADVPRQTAEAFTVLFDYGSSFLYQLPSSGLPAVTEEPAEVQDSGAAREVALTEEAVQAVTAQAAGQSSVDAVIVEALAVAGAESAPAAIGASPRRDGVEAATAAWRNRAFNAAFQGSPSLSGSREASPKSAAALEVTSSPVRRSAGDGGRNDDEDSVAPSPAEEHPRSHRLQRSDSLDSLASLAGMASLDSSGAAEAAEAAHARLARGGADLRASLEAVAQNIRSIVARRPEPFAPAQPTIDEGPEAAGFVEPEGFASPISMATPTSAGASPTAHSPQEEEVDVLTALPDYAEVEEVDELKALPDEEPQAATEEKPAHVGLVRTTSNVRPNWATAPSTGVADLLHGLLAVCLIAALAAHLRFLPNASVRPRLAAGPGGLGVTGAAAVYPGSLAQTWEGARSSILRGWAAVPALSTLMTRSGLPPRYAAPAAPSMDDGGHCARPPAPLLVGKARASEKRFREQGLAVPSASEEASSSASPPAPLIGTAARASAARFAVQTASPPRSTAAKPAAGPPLAAAPAPGAAKSAPRSAQPAAQPATPASSANPTTAPNTGANPSQEQPASQQLTVDTKQTPSTAARATAAAESESADATAESPSMAMAPMPAMLSRWVARARQSLQPEMAARGIKTVPLAAVLSAAAPRPAQTGSGALGDIEGLGGVPLAPALATAAAMLLAALGVGAALLRRGPGANGEASNPAEEELEELQEGVDEQHEASSIVTSMVSPAPSVSRLSSRMTGSALRGSAMRTTSRRPPASQQRATSRRSASVHDGDDVASDGEAASRGHGSDAEAEEEAGSPIVSVSRSLRRLTRAVSHTISGAVSAPVGVGEEVMSKRTPQTAPRRAARRNIRHTTASTAEPVTRRITRSSRSAL